MLMEKQTYIQIKGARVHNLKHVDLNIPRDKLVVITGLSGSGKSSLAFDTIYADGQRKYMESLSSYARQFLGQMDKPEVDSIEGLSPAISIAQKSTNHNPRSTVGTVTEIYDYLRLLFARIGIPHCPECGKEIQRQTVDQMVEQIMALPDRSKIFVLAPVVRQRKGRHEKVLQQASKSGFVRVMIDGDMVELSEPIELNHNKKHDIQIVVDRLVIKEGIESRLTDSLEQSMHLTEGIVQIDVVDGESFTLSSHYACPDCHISLSEIEPIHFSFNNALGACPHCEGIGYEMAFDEALMIPDPSLSIDEGAIQVYSWQSSKDKGSFTRAILDKLSEKFNFRLDVPFESYSKEIHDILIYGTDQEVTVSYNGRYGPGVYDIAFDGLIKNVEQRYHRNSGAGAKAEFESFMRITPCKHCHGKRLNKEALAVTVADNNIDDIVNMSVKELIPFFQGLTLSAHQQAIAERILKEIKERIRFLSNVGLDYLTLERGASTLSGGEAQRIRLATQIGSGLVGVTYILDEPSIGLHQRDNDKLIATLHHLRDLGNTVLVVEHDQDTIKAADYIIDIGPGAGEHGGEVVAEGAYEEILVNDHSVTGKYLRGDLKIEVPSQRREPRGMLTVRNAHENNLKHIDVDIPLGVFSCVTGVSGSGKSSLVNEILYKALAKKLNRARTVAGKHDRIEGSDQLDKIIDIDQSPIGRTPRSNPATYIGVFDMIRDLFASTQEAKTRGYKKGRFSFNVKGGRCEACSGDGILKVEMHFLPDVYVPCEVCKGKRYNRETLEVKYKGKNIHDILEMTVEEGLTFFENIPRVLRKIQTLYDVGLGYIRLGQPSNTLSGGEAQRIKLASELSKRSTGKTIYILDEPTTGLHFEDVRKLIVILQQLVDEGNTVLVIEHNMDVIKNADYIIDIGPEGGDGGGTIVAKGRPEALVKVKESYTGQYLKQYLN
jgi:excinuclease ABC subunit A